MADNLIKNIIQILSKNPYTTTKDLSKTLQEDFAYDLKTVNKNKINSLLYKNEDTLFNKTKQNANIRIIINNYS